MASWRDSMRPATFRGVPFHVDSAEFEGGRETVTHKFPLRSVPYVEDLGRAARVFPIEGYVVGDDYLARKDALLAALEEEGSGELVHPYYGTRRVAVTGRVRVRETKNDGGMATFSVEFTETEEGPRFPTAAPAGAGAVDAAATAARAAAAADFVARYETPNLLDGPLAALEAAAEQVDSALAVARLPLEEAAATRVRLDRILATAGALLAAPATLVDEYLALFDSIASLDALALIYRFDPGLRPPATTASRLAEQAAFDLIVWLVRIGVTVRGARVAPSFAFDSYDAATAARDALLEQLDEQAESAGDASFAALMDLRANLVRAVPGEDADLPRLVRYSPPATVPSLVLAHRLYGDLAREADLVTRNGIERPGFILGGVELEVLSAAE